MRLQASLGGARALLVGVVAYLAVTRFTGSTAAATVQDLWEQYLGGLPLGRLAGYLVIHASLVISLALLAAPVFSALFRRGPRSIVWLVIVAYVLLAPAALATSWIDWFHFLGDGAAKSFAAPGTSPISVTAAVVAVAGALYLLWQTDRLQTDVARLRASRMPSHDIVRYAFGHVGTAFLVALGALALGGVAYAIARLIMLATGELDPRSWVSLGVVVAGLIAAAGTIATIATARGR